MSPVLVLLVGAAIIAASIWLSHFIYSMRTPVDRINDLDAEDAQRLGFGVGFVVAVVVISMIGTYATLHP